MKAKVIKTGEIVDVYHELQHGEVSNIYKESVFVNTRMWSEDELDFCVKANEAPEKIYLVNDDINNKQDWYKTKQVGFETTEYTRTDAFIEKADKYLNNKFIDDVCVLADGEVRINFSTAFKNFINYMKGE